MGLLFVDRVVLEVGGFFIIDALADGCCKGANQTGMSLNYGRGTIDGKRR